MKSAPAAAGRPELHQLGPVALIGGCLIVLAQGLQLLLATWPFFPGQAAWRYRAAILASGSISAALIADLIIAVVVVSAGSRWGLRVWVWAQFVAAVLIAAVTVIELRDSGETAATIVASQATRFAGLRLRALIVTSGGVAMFLVLGLIGLRAGARGSAVAGVSEASPS